MMMEKRWTTTSSVLLEGLENELGYFSLKELESLKGPFGLTIERDLFFGKYTLAEVMERRL